MASPELRTVDSPKFPEVIQKDSIAALQLRGEIPMQDGRLGAFDRNPQGEPVNGRRNLWKEEADARVRESAIRQPGYEFHQKLSDIWHGRMPKDNGSMSMEK